MVIAGMGKSKDMVDEGMASAVMKYWRYRRCSDTRAFDDVRKHNTVCCEVLQTVRAASTHNRTYLTLFNDNPTIHNADLIRLIKNMQSMQRCF